MINKKDVLHIITILITSLFAVITTLTTSNPVFHVIALWILVLVAIFISKFDLLHPYFWFSSFFALYSSAYTIILVQGFQTNTGYSYENTLLSIIALTTVLLTIGPKKNESKEIDSEKSSCPKTSNLNVDRRLLRNVLFILFVILVISVTIVSRLGIQSKSEFISNSYFSFRVATYTVRYITLFCCLYLVICGKRFKYGPIILLCGIAVLFFSLFTAERDGIFRFLLVVVCAMFATQRIKRKTLPIVIGISMVAVVMLSYLKYFFVNGSVRVGYNDHGIIYNFLNSDFAAAGENMQVLLNNPWTKSFNNYFLILTDLLSPFTIGFSTFNIGVWFNDTFYYGKSSRAFTLLGEGYVIGGYLGVIVLFFVVGILVGTMYKKSIKNEYWLTAYIFTIATVASSFRGTLSSITVTLVKIAVVGLVGYIFYKTLLLRRQRTQQAFDVVRYGIKVSKGIENKSYTKKA
ncbi:O-antigen polymerase [Neobacillus niacini]|uniref:O-antigen polymerase n=1 Tax=Neobacillus niacini TaxID=86668 RepID=UPI0021CB48A6|nr:O-antigen polymerase [Neobacillus niacini]MCM3763932.1 oligosaccharide repeat unit polymerase [Neobacillus niacini]